MSENNFVKLVMPGDLNPSGNLFGGTMMAWLDKATAIFAMEYTGNNCVTYLVEGIRFLNPVKLGDMVKIVISEHKEGTTSLTVKAVAYKKKVTDPLGSPYIEVCNASFVYVALDESDKKTDKWVNRENSLT